MSGSKWRRETDEQCFTHHFTCKILYNALSILSVVRVSSVSGECVCVRLCSQNSLWCLIEQRLTNMGVV